MASFLHDNKHAALTALRDLQIAMRFIAGNESLPDAYSAVTGSTGNNSSKWADKPTSQYWLTAVKVAKEATDEAIASAIEGSQLLILADPAASNKDKTAAAALLAKCRGLDKLKIEVEQKPAWQQFIEDELAMCSSQLPSPPQDHFIDV